MAKSKRQRKRLRKVVGVDQDLGAIGRAIKDLTPPRYTLESLLQRFTHGDLKHLTWVQFEAKLHKSEGAHG